MTPLLVFVFAGIGTYLARSAFILVVGDRALPPLLERGLLYVGPAVLAALSASLLTSPRGFGAFIGQVPEVVGTIVGVIVAWRFRRFDVSFSAAMIAFFGLTAVM